MIDKDTIDKYMSFAGIPANEYSVGELVNGRVCVVENAVGEWEVVDMRGGPVRRLQVLPTDELACYYLFGVLAEVHIESGLLVPANR